MPGYPLSAVVGLGNPGSKYDKTFHNLGFWVVDELARRLNAKFKENFQSEIAVVDYRGGKLALMKPLTFMNLSGESVGPAARFYKWQPESILVISDDLDLPAGALRIRPKGGSGGHNGLKSIIQHLGAQDFPRIRLGIGRNENAGVTGHVLGKIGSSQKEQFETLAKTAADAVIAMMDLGMEKAMSQFNSTGEAKPEPEKKKPESKETKS